MDSEILLYTKPANMTSMQYADDLYVKSYKVANIYGNATINNIFIDGDDSSICHSYSLRKYWATHPHVDVTNTAFKVQPPLAIPNGTVKPASSGNHAARSKIIARSNCISRQQTLLKQNH